jgi:hypothetical protein
MNDSNGIHHDISTFTCIAFDRADEIKDTVANIDRSLSNNLTQWFALPADQREAAQQRWIHESTRFGWGLPGGSMDLYKELYERALQPDTPDEAQLRSDLIRTYIQELK